MITRRMVDGNISREEATSMGSGKDLGMVVMEAQRRHGLSLKPVTYGGAKAMMGRGRRWSMEATL